MSTITKILAGETGLDGVQELLSPTAIRPALQRMLDQPDALGTCHLRRAKFKPGRKLTAYYDLEVGDPAQPTSGGTMRSVAVTWTQPGVPEKKLATAAGEQGAEIAQRGLAEPFRQLLNTHANANMHVQVAPLDPIYPQLARLTDPTYVGKMLRDCVDKEAAWDVTPIRYRPRQRHVLRYDSCHAAHNGQHGVPASNERTTLFAKLYPDGRRAHFCALSHRLAEWFATTTSDTAILRPLAYLPAETTILYGAVQGEPISMKLDEADTADDGTLTQQLHQTGTALRTLHGAPKELTSGLPAIDITTEIKAITRTCEHIQALLPAVGERITSLLGRATERYAALPQAAPTFIHGDFKADHVLAVGARLTLIDFDSCALADPAFDIGKFLADLAWWHGDTRPAALAEARNAFLSGYSLLPTHPRLDRARIWEALIGIKIIAHRVRIFDTQWATRTTTGIQRIAERFG